MKSEGKEHIKHSLLRGHITTHTQPNAKVRLFLRAPQGVRAGFLRRSCRPSNARPSSLLSPVRPLHLDGRSGKAVHTYGHRLRGAVVLLLGLSGSYLLCLVHKLFTVGVYHFAVVAVQFRTLPVQHSSTQVLWFG